MKNESRIDPAGLQQLLQLDTQGRKRRTWGWWIAATVIILALVLWYFSTGTSGNKIRYITQPAEHGDIDVIVTATGNLQPTNKVDVGIEVSGTVAALHADFNDHVQAGQLLMELDTSKLEAQLLASKAALESAKARLLQADATVEESESELQRLRQVHKLSNGRMPSQSQLDTASASVKRARADSASSKAAVAQAEAALELDKTNLAKAKVHSPITGLVLNRAVELGQTVAASFSTPVLFTLAEDLAKMELHVGVDEADVGQVKDGQNAFFTVDAYPDKHFPAKILQVRYGSQEVNGVITYETVLNVDNQELLLRPGMTATAEITVQEVKDSLLVPMAALRFSPPEAPTKAAASGGNVFNRLMFRPPRQNQGKKSVGSSKQQRVWILRDGNPVPVSIITGVDNGSMAEVVSGDLQAGDLLITDSTSTTP